MMKSIKKGFTLVELVIVIAVIAILAAVMIPTFSNVIANANRSSDLQEVKANVDAAYQEYITENVTSTNVIPEGVTLDRPIGSESISNGYLTFTADSHDMYEVFADAKGVSYTITTATVAAGSSITIQVETNKYYTFTATADLAVGDKIYASANVIAVYADGVYYTATSATTGTQTTNVTTDATAATVYYAAAATTKNNQSEAKETVACDYAYVTGRKGYVFKVVVYEYKTGEFTYEVIDMGGTEKELGYPDGTTLINFNKVIVGTNAANVFAAGNDYTVTAGTHVLTNATISSIPTSVKYGDTVTITVTASTGTFAAGSVSVNVTGATVTIAGDSQTATITFTVTEDTTVTVTATATA